MATAIAARAPLKVGTAILVPYFRNPIDVADAVLAISELTEGREISLGIAKGSKGQVPQYLEMTKPFRVVRETVGFLGTLFRGERVRFDEYPTLCELLPHESPGPHRVGASTRGASAFLRRRRGAPVPGHRR